MKLLLDTNVISELRKARSGKANPSVMNWFHSVDPSDSFISCITAMEIEMGILAVLRKDQQQGLILKSWFEDQVLQVFNRRVLPIDLEVARKCAQLHVPNRRSERDALIAATALVHNMSVVTRNVSDFAPMKIKITNPWQD